MSGDVDALERSAMEIVRYGVSVAEGSRGDLLSIDGRASGASGASRKCWDLLQGRAEPCETCPLFAGGAQTGSRSVRALDAEHGFHQIVELMRSDTTAELRVLRVSDVVASVLCADKLRRIGARARLSPQETKVFELIAYGFQTKEIARAIDISERTVKFHGANLLRKIGADSRLAILSLIVGSDGKKDAQPAAKARHRSGKKRAPRARRAT